MDGIRATPYANSMLGSANDIIGGLLGYMRDPRRTQQMQGLAGLLESTGVPKTIERLAYGEPLTNVQKANVPVLRPETAEALLTLLPVPSGTNKALKAADPLVQKYGPKLEQSLLPAFESAYNRGGVTREMVEAMGNQTVSPLTVFHGSPAKFNRFDRTKIGTGEGAQAYGYGHYVAESPEVAEGYRKTLSQNNLINAGKKTEFNDMDSVLAGVTNDISQKNGDINAVKEMYKKMSKQKFGGDIAKQRLNVLNKLEGDISIERGGSLYEIDLPDEQIAKMLDWDKPLNRQSDEVKAAIEPIVEELRKAAKMDFIGEVTGQGIYDILGSGLKSQQTANKLKELGIPGIRYLDQDSRGAGGGTSNFVVFPGNEDLLTILRRNGGLLD